MLLTKSVFLEMGFCDDLSEIHILLTWDLINRAPQLRPTAALYLTDEAPLLGTML
jgi:hypothetical protein